MGFGHGMQRRCSAGGKGGRREEAERRQLEMKRMGMRELEMETERKFWANSLPQTAVDAPGVCRDGQVSVPARSFK